MSLFSFLALVMCFVVLFNSIIIYTMSYFLAKLNYFGLHRNMSYFKLFVLVVIYQTYFPN
jgi:hypothetical protein